MSESGNRGRRLRLTILLGILGLALLAWWYDWKVARPRVDAAWDQINRLNETINAKASSHAMTNLDVQKSLDRQPVRTISVGAYQVEVYSWLAGLPFRTHDYYAVYNPANGSLLFSTHFKFELPRDELEAPTRSLPPGDASSQQTEMTIPEPLPLGPSRGDESPSRAPAPSDAKPSEPVKENPDGEKEKNAPATAGDAKVEGAKPENPPAESPADSPPPAPEKQPS